MSIQFFAHFKNPHPKICVEILGLERRGREIMREKKREASIGCFLCTPLGIKPPTQVRALIDQTHNLFAVWMKLQITKPPGQSCPFFNQVLFLFCY